jgi:hypothetical protein
VWIVAAAKAEVLQVRLPNLMRRGLRLLPSLVNDKRRRSAG